MKKNTSALLCVTRWTMRNEGFYRIKSMFKLSSNYAFQLYRLISAMFHRLLNILNTLRFIANRERSHMTSAAEGEGGFKMLTVAEKGGGGRGS